MASYVQKEDPLEHLDDMTPEQQIHTLKNLNRLLQVEHETTLLFVEFMKRALWSFGLRVMQTIGRGNAVLEYGGLKPCKCKRRPTIQEDAAAEGEWLVMCNECTLRTESFKKIKDAVNAWNNNQYTHDSEMLQEKLDPKEILYSSARQLIGGIRARAAEDYLASLETDHPDKIIEEVFPSRSKKWKRLYETKKAEEEKKKKTEVTEAG